MCVLAERKQTQKIRQFLLHLLHTFWHIDVESTGITFAINF